MSHPHDIGRQPDTPESSPLTRLWRVTRHALGLMAAAALLVAVAVAVRPEVPETRSNEYSDVWNLHALTVELEQLYLVALEVGRGDDSSGDALGLQLESMLLTLQEQTDSPQADGVLGTLPAALAQRWAVSSEIRGWAERMKTADAIERVEISSDIVSELPVLRDQLHTAVASVRQALVQRTAHERAIAQRRTDLMLGAVLVLAFALAVTALRLFHARRRAAGLAARYRSLRDDLEARVNARTAELEARGKLLDDMLEASPADVVLSDAASGRVHFINKRLVQRLGLPADVHTLPAEYLLADSQTGASFVTDLERLGRIDAREARMAGIPPYTGLLSARKLVVDGTPAYLVWSVDISERLALEARLHEQANADALTGLSNRNAFFAKASQVLAQARRHARPCTLLLIDIDDFKRLNDSHGSEVGDLVIQAVAGVLRGHARESDVTARLSSEEFAVLLTETAQVDALRVARRLHAFINELRVTHDNAQPLRFTSSIGVAQASEDDRTVDALLQRADTALYLAKRNGHNRIEVMMLPDDGTDASTATDAVAPSP